MFGDKISMADTLFISLFSILFVFFVLWIISYLIDLVSLVLKKFAKGEEKQKIDSHKKANREDGEQTELVAVITAAVCEFEGCSSVKINSIKHNGNSLWEKSGKIENVTK